MTAIGPEVDPADLPARLAEGVEALRAERWHDALTPLRQVATSPDLATAEGLGDVRARACSLYAQALLECGRARDAEAPCREALRLLRGLRDKAGIDAVRALQDRIVRAIAHDAEQAVRAQEMATVSATPLATLLDRATTPTMRVEAMMRKAHALADHPDQASEDDGTAVSAMAVREADVLGDVRLRVLSRIAASRHAAPDDAASWLEDAARLAGDAEEFNLVATIARAAEVQGVALAKHPGPHAGHDGRAS